MAILTPEQFQELTAQSITGDNLAALTGWCAAVSNAILRAIRPFYPEPITVTDCVLDAPPSRDLILPITPARSITTVYYRSDAHGVVSAFTSDYLIDNSNGDEYQLLIDDPIQGWSRQGILRRIGAVWGYENIAYPTRLAQTLGPERGSVKVTYTAGALSMPPEIEAAAVLAVAMLYNRKTTGLPTVSESWNGYSASYGGPFTASGVINTPDIQNLLQPYLPHVLVGRP